MAPLPSRELQVPETPGWGLAKVPPPGDAAQPEAGLGQTIPGLTQEGVGAGRRGAPCLYHPQRGAKRTLS